MIPNPRIHRPSARSYVPTITQSTALWKAMRHREEMERRRQVLRADFAGIRLFSWIRQAVASLPFLRQRS